MSYIIIDRSADAALANRLLDSNFSGTLLAGTPEDDDNDASGIMVANRQTFSAADLPAPDDEASNGASTIRMYRIAGATVFVEGGENSALGIHGPKATIKDFLSDWYFGDDIEWCVGMAGFGYDREAAEAAEGAVDVRVWQVPNYLGSQINPPLADYVRDDAHDPVVFATRGDAQAWIDGQDAQPYSLADGEASRPEYVIVK